MNKKSNKAFSLTEVLVATFIWAIILWFISIFLWDILDNMSKSKKEIKALTTYFDFSNKLVNYKDIYNTWSIFIDNDTASWSDLFIMKNSLGDSWILFWVVNLTNYKIDLDNSTYKNTWIGFRYLSSDDINNIDNDQNLVYSLLFQKSNVYSDLNIKDMQIASYNSGSLFDMNLFVNVDYQNSLEWELWKNLPKDNLFKFNLNF